MVIGNHNRLPRSIMLTALASRSCRPRDKLYAYGGTTSAVVVLLLVVVFYLHEQSDRACNLLHNEQHLQRRPRVE